MKKNVAGVVGLFLLLGFFVGGIDYMLDWSSAELVGRNLVGVIELSGGIWLIYYALKNRK